MDVPMIFGIIFCLTLVEGASAVVLPLNGSVVGETVCYGTLGCFTSQYPFNNAGGRLPASPEEIGVKLYIYTEDPLHTGNFLKTELNFDVKSQPEHLYRYCNTFVVIHGYREDIYKPHLLDLFGELVSYGGASVIIVDWSEGANVLYDQSVANTRVVGAFVASYLQLLIDMSITSPKYIHLIGYSLGAHVSGYIGEAIPDIGRISALDPASPLFHGTAVEVRIDSTDAQFVDVIHTSGDSLWHLVNVVTTGDYPNALGEGPGVVNAPGSAGTLDCLISVLRVFWFGMTEPVGHVDFYPNGGMRQPDCGSTWSYLISLAMGSGSDLTCSHRRSVELYTESINSECTFRANPCLMGELTENLCSPCEDSLCVRMGFHASNSSRGSYYLSTYSTRPFCKD